MQGAGRYVLWLGALCLVCGASVAIAFAAPGHPPPHPASAARKACHRTKHRHCPQTRSRNRSRHKHKSGTSAKPSNPTNGPVSGTSGSALSPASAPESTANSGATRPGEKVAPVKSPATPPPTHVEVTAEDSEGFRFVLSRPSVPAGKAIIEFVNHGQDEHNLNAEENEGAVVGSLPNTPSNDHLSLTIDLKPGSYTLFCSLPGHAAKGMKATLIVE